MAEVRSNIDADGFMYSCYAPWEAPFVSSQPDTPSIRSQCFDGLDTDKRVRADALRGLAARNTFPSGGDVTIKFTDLRVGTFVLLNTTSAFSFHSLFLFGT